MTSKRENWLLFTLAGIQFTHILDFMIMMPLGPQFTRIFGINDSQFGLLVSAYTLAGGLSGLAASTFIERFGRKRVLLTLYTFFGLSALACAVAPGYTTLMLARILAGTFGGILSSLSQTIVGDVIPFERRGRAMGIIMSSFSLASVAGVPVGLWLAEHFGWHAPFFGIAGLCAILAIFAALTMPPLDDHVGQQTGTSAVGRIKAVLADANHRRAYALSAAMMLAGFTVVPYLAINLQYGIGLRSDQLPYVYLFGGMATLLLARWFGRMTDRWGKVPSFRLMSSIVVIPMFAVTLLPFGTPLWGAIAVSTLFMICMNGRMIPGMAIITSAANPALRGTFMTLNASVQSAAMGIAALVGGHLISRSANGQVLGYWQTAVVGAGFSLAAVWLAGRLNLHTAPAPTAQKHG